MIYIYQSGMLPAQLLGFYPIVATVDRPLVTHVV